MVSSCSNTRMAMKAASGSASRNTPANGSTVTHRVVIITVFANFSITIHKNPTPPHVAAYVGVPRVDTRVHDSDEQVLHRLTFDIHSR